MSEDRPPDILDDLIKRIKNYQVANDLAQAHVARLSGISPPALCYLMKRLWMRFGDQVYLSVIQLVVPLDEQEAYRGAFAAEWVKHRHARIEVAPGSETPRSELE